MKLRTLFFTSLLLFCFNGISSQLCLAQDSNTEDRISIRVSANIMNSVDMVTVRDIQFGPVQPGQEQINIDALQDSETGKMIANGVANANIRVSFVRERILTRTDGFETLTFTYEVSGNDQDDQSSAELLQTDNRNLELNDEGEYFFWIGGQVNIEDAKPGNYNGDFTIEVEYI